MRSRCTILLAGVAVAAIATGGALAAPAPHPGSVAVLDATVSFDIPAQPLDTALLQYARQARVQVISSSPTLANRGAPPVQGSQTPRQALAQLLRGSNLSFVTTDDATVTITSAPPAKTERRATVATPVVLQGTMASAPAASAQATVASAEGQVGEVIVTAQRRAERLQETPLAITAVSPAQLQERVIQSTNDLMQVAPSLQVSTEVSGRGSGSAMFYLRGIGQQLSSNGTEPGVGVYIDDLYYPVAQGAMFSILDLQQVEVLRGPQGTLFGRNSIGGAIRYTTRQPRFTESGGYVQGTLGSYDRNDLMGSYNIAISDKVAALVTGGRLRTDGFVKQQNGGKPAGGREVDLARVALRLAPTERLDVTLAGQYSRTYDDGQAYVMPDSFGPPFSPQATNWNRLFPNNPYDNRYRSTCDYCQAGTTFREFSKSEFTLLSATARWSLGQNLDFKSITGYQQVVSDRHIDQDGTPLPMYQMADPAKYPGTEHSLAYSQEFQLSGQSLEDRFKWVGGVFLYEQDNGAYGGFNLRNGVNNPPNKVTSHVASRAAFVDGNFKVAEKVTILGGVRLNRDVKENAILTVTDTLVKSAHQTFDSTTWRAGGQVQWLDNVMTYATVSTGFRGGGINQSQAPGTTFPTGVTYFAFEPETATNYEFGARMDLFGRRIRFNPTLFYTTWKDIQVQDVIPTDTGTYRTVYNIASGATIKGGELETEAVINRNLNVYANLAYLEGDFGKSPAPPPLFKQLPRIPKITYNTGFRHRMEVLGGYRLTTTGSYSWVASQRSQPTTNEAILLPSYGVLNGRIELTNPGGNWSLAVFGTNLGKEVYYVGGVNYIVNIAANHYDIGRPREYGVQLRYNF